MKRESTSPARDSDPIAAAADTLAKAMADAQKALSAARADKVSANIALAQSQEEVQDLKAAILRLQGDLGAAHTRCEELATDRDSQRQNAEAMARTTHELEERIAALEQSRRDERTNLDAERAEIETSKVALIADRKRLQREQEQLKKDKCASRAAVSAIKRIVGGLDSQLADPSEGDEYIDTDNDQDRRSVSTRKCKRTEDVSSPHREDETPHGSHVAGSSADSSRSPSPTTGPIRSALALFADLSPKTPVCIGQLGVTAHVLSLIPYLSVSTTDEEWAPVCLQYVVYPRKGGAGTYVPPHVINILAPAALAPDGKQIPSEVFGIIEEKAATALGPMLEKGLIRLGAKIRRDPANLRTLPVQMAVYTPKGNIPAVGNYMREQVLLLDDLSPAFENGSVPYHNPHKSAPDQHLARERDKEPGQ
ncbi:hypothetical protein B0H13DRAFT_2353043 [Mycena leptocephala]|nr:hypothetical protein B0H13DRAFT_2353043 [Mycena leptocephala]